MRITRYIGILCGALFLLAQTSLTASAAGLPGQGPGSWYGSTSSSLSPVTDVVNVVVYGQFRGFNHVNYLIERSGHGWGGNFFSNDIYGRDTNQTRTEDAKEARGDFFCQSSFCRNHYRIWSDRCSWTCNGGGATPNQPTIIMASYEMFVGALNGVHKVTDFDNAAHDVWHDVLQTCSPLHTSCTNQYLVTGVYRGGTVSGAQPDPSGWRSAAIHYSGNVYTFTLN